MWGALLLLLVVLLVVVGGMVTLVLRGGGEAAAAAAAAAAAGAGGAAGGATAGGAASAAAVRAGQRLYTGAPLAEECRDASKWVAATSGATHLPFEQNAAVWKTSKPGHYLALATQSVPEALVGSFLWSDGGTPPAALRQMCSNDVERFLWTKHDGESFGRQEIDDSAINTQLLTSFVTHPQAYGHDADHDTDGVEWAVRVQADVVRAPRAAGEPGPALYWTFGADCDGNLDDHACHEAVPLHVPHDDIQVSHTAGVATLTARLDVGGRFGHFLLVANVYTSDDGTDGHGVGDTSTSASSPAEITYATGERSELRHRADEIRDDQQTTLQRWRRQQRTRNERPQRHRSAAEDNTSNNDESPPSGLSNQIVPSPNTIFLQAKRTSGDGSGPMVMDVVLLRLSSPSTAASASAVPTFAKLSAPEQIHSVGTWLTHAEATFDARFDRTFLPMQPLTRSTRGGSSAPSEEAQRRGAMAALSNLLGGVGLFYGQSLIRSARQELGDADGAGGEGLDMEPRDTFAAPLLTATPSRSVFPRGFLWDEGFHQLLVSEWDVSLSLRILETWIGAMHRHAEFPDKCPGAWIPREMILGAEARSRVPDEFLVQTVDVANPPTFFLLLHRLLDRMELPFEDADTSPVEDAACDASEQTCTIPDEHDRQDQQQRNPSALTSQEAHDIRQFLLRHHTALEAWLEWYMATQRGPVDLDGTYAWRGRNRDEPRLLPNTMASGLDDYPRGSDPGPDDRHVDMLCWIAAASRALARVQRVVIEALRDPDAHPDVGDTIQSLEERAAEFDAQAKYLEKRLVEEHWSAEHAAFLDVGLHSEEGTIVSEVQIRCVRARPRSGEPRTQDFGLSLNEFQERRSTNTLCPSGFDNGYPLSGPGPTGLLQRTVYRRGADLRVQHVPRIGYVSIFPLLLKVLDPEAPQLSAVLNVLESRQHLWTDYGLRSLGRTDRFYNVENGPGDLPYWRGPIWINVNYLAVCALKHYGSTPGPQQARAHKLFEQLRQNVARTVLSEYARTGDLWEHYNDQTGHGMRGHPFSGWTALAVSLVTQEPHC